MRKNLLIGLLLSALVSVASSVLYLTGGLQRLEWQTQDWRMRSFNSEKPAPDDIAIIMIDEASMKYMNDFVGRWPWPRSVHADLIQFLSAAPPRALLFDVLFTERQSPDVDGVLNSEDQALVDETAAVDFVSHAVHFIKGDNAEDARSADLPPAFAARFSLSRHPGIKLDSALTAAWPAHHAHDQILLPIAPLHQAAPGIGVVFAESDADGVYRRVHLLHRFADDFFPALSLAGLLRMLPVDRLGYADGKLQLAGREIPLADDATFLINHYGKFNTYSYSWLMNAKRRMENGDVEGIDEVLKEFRDKIVFVGANAAAVYDLKSTPIAPDVAGVFIHASAAGNILRGDFLRQAGKPLVVTLLLVFATLICLTTLLSQTLYLRTGIPALLFLGFNTLAYLLFAGNLLLDMVAPSLAIALASATSFTYLTFTEGKDKRKVRKVLSQYVSPQILAEVVDNYGDFLQAEVGSRENLTVLFSDIRGFTTLSETMSGERVVEMLNIYFSAMTDTIFSHNGTIDKFIGDAIMAFWGAPVRTRTHAHDAVAAALKMVQLLPDVNAALAAKGYTPLEIGIGLNSGEVVLGNIGSEKKLDYTVIGDNVNLASRLEGLTKQYGCPILFSEYTYAYIMEEIPCRIVDMVRVKGKHHPIRIYAPVLAPAQAAADARDQIQKICALTHEGFDHYLRRRWEDAIACYRQLPDDRLRAIMIERCSAYQQQQPESGWDGVFTMKSK